MSIFWKQAVSRVPPLGRGVISLPQARKRNTATQPRITRTIARVSSTLRVVASIPQAITLNILVRLSVNLFSSTLSRQSLLHSPPLAGLQVIRVTLYVPNDVLRLNLALEAAEGILQRFALLQSNFCQTKKHPQTYPVGLVKLLQCWGHKSSRIRMWDDKKAP